jgi:periplasmic divalent cation tolerance protein
MKAHHRLLLCACPTRETALELAEHLVTERLAACVSLVPDVTSVYRWEGNIQRESEVLLLIKTTLERAGQLTERLRQLHPYEVPEIIAIPITAGLHDYLSWVTTCTKEQD